jgi:hypothetical protein
VVKDLFYHFIFLFSSPPSGHICVFIYTKNLLSQLFEMSCKQRLTMMLCVHRQCRRTLLFSNLVDTHMIVVRSSARLMLFSARYTTHQQLIGHT